MEFDRLAGGAFVVTAWWIRMPEFQRVVESDALARGAWVREAAEAADARRRRRRAGLAVREVGDRVMDVARRPVDEPAPSAWGVVRGTGWDSLARAPLSGARVHEMAAGRSAVTDAQGQ